MIREITDDGFGPVIFSYSRVQAIADGVLVDISGLPIVRQHWRAPMACTAAVWTEIQDAVSHGCDIDGVLHDLSWMAKCAIKLDPGQDHVLFDCTVGTNLRQYKLHCGPGDDGQLVLTLMFANED